MQPCCELTHHESPWLKLYHCGDASTFLTLTGISRQAQAFTHLNNAVF